MSAARHADEIVESFPLNLLFNACDARYFGFSRRRFQSKIGYDFAGLIVVGIDTIQQFRAPVLRCRGTNPMLNR
jgi:hypothetical protein